MEFAIKLSIERFHELSNFFIEQMTFTSTNNAIVVKQKLDSIKYELDQVRYRYASLSDQSLGLLLQVDKVNLKSLAIKEQMLNVMYAEAQKNYESFQFMNQAAAPSLTLIEEPFSPLNPEKKSKLKFTIFFSLLLCFFLFLFFRLMFVIKRYLPN